ncbi:MAG: hypothetical protein ACI9N9_000033 [Enterobacterales bacterium]|jgi:hypothetical protein
MSEAKKKAEATKAEIRFTKRLIKRIRFWRDEPQQVREELTKP